MSIPVKAIVIAASVMCANVQAEESLDMDLLLFLAEFTDEHGDWNGPEIDEENVPIIETGEEQ